jgi:hypothetical protein
MPYHVGEKGSYGCEGYPALKEDGTVMGCHETAAEAANQIYAINQSEGNIGKQSPCWDGYVQRGMKPGDDGGMVPNCVPVEKAADMDLFADFGKDYTKSQTNVYHSEEN